MTQSPSQFTWQVSRSGYLIFEGRASQRPPKQVAASDKDRNPATGYERGWAAEDKWEAVIRTWPRSRMRSYRPFDPPYVHLFRRFAETPETLDGIKDFATEYGLLGLNRTALARRPSHPDLESEPVESWYLHIREMREAIRRWDAFRAVGSSFSAPRSANVLVDFVNLRLAGTVVQRVSFDSTRGEFSSLPEPLSLLGCLWLQLSHAMGRPATYGKCPACGRVIEMATGRLTGKRKGTTFCNDNCRTRFNNRLRSQGNALLRQGKSPAFVAKELGVTPERVVSWQALMASRRKRRG